MWLGVLGEFVGAILEVAVDSINLYSFIHSDPPSPRPGCQSCRYPMKRPASRTHCLSCGRPLPAARPLPATRPDTPWNPQQSQTAVDQFGGPARQVGGQSPPQTKSPTPR